MASQLVEIDDVVREVAFTATQTGWAHSRSREALTVLTNGIGPARFIVSKLSGHCLFIFCSTGRSLHAHVSGDFAR